MIPEPLQQYRRSFLLVQLQDRVLLRPRVQHSMNPERHFLSEVALEALHEKPTTAHGDLDKARP